MQFYYSVLCRDSKYFIFKFCIWDSLFGASLMFVAAVLFAVWIVGASGPRIVHDRAIISVFKIFQFKIIIMAFHLFSFCRYLRSMFYARYMRLMRKFLALLCRFLCINIYTQTIFATHNRLWKSGVPLCEPHKPAAHTHRISTLTENIKKRRRTKNFARKIINNSTWL